MVSTHQPVTVLLADANDVSRFGLRGLLQEDTRFSVIGDVPADVIDAARRLQPDLIIIDPAHGGELDLHVIDELHRVASNARLVVFTATFEPRSFMAVMLRRVHGYLLKDAGGHGPLLLDGMELIVRYGVVVVGPDIAQHFWSIPDSSIAVYRTVPAVLTTREAEILALIVQGNTDKQVADRLSLSVRTVEYHVERASQKLGAPNRIEVGWLLYERGVLQPTV